MVGVRIEGEDGHQGTWCQSRTGRYFGKGLAPESDNGLVDLLSGRESPPEERVPYRPVGGFSGEKRLVRSVDGVEERGGGPGRTFKV